MLELEEGGRPFPNSYWVRPFRFLAGEYPGPMNSEETRRKLRLLLACGVTFCVDLTHEHELRSYESLLRTEALAVGRAVEYGRMPIQDFGVPSVAAMSQILDLLDRALGAGHVVYLHCWGGIGRTGTVVGCYLARHGMAGEQALAELQSLRQVLPQAYRRRASPETEEQRRMVLHWPAGL